MAERDERPPALPPRPTSTVNTPGPQYGPQSTEQWPAYDALQSQQTYHQQQPSWSGTYDQQSTYNHAAPPPPPPKPPVYEQTNQQYSQPVAPPDQYSHHPPTHHYDPQASGNPYDRYTPTPGPIQGSAHDPAPVSPIEPGSNRWQASRPPVTSSFQAPAQASAPPSSNHFYSTALGPYGGPSDWEHFGNEGAGSPDAATPASTHVNPAADNDVLPPLPTRKQSVPTVQQSPPKVSAKPVQASRHGSETSSTIGQPVRRTDTIDGVINAWSAPLKFGPKPDPSLVDNNSSRPVSRDSGRNDPPQERIVEVVKEVVKVVDPYDDLQPEVKASLKRYADMLRKESAAETDEEKFAAFEAFIKKELRLRAMLYGMDSPLQLIKTQERTAIPATVVNTAPALPSVIPPPVPLPAPVPSDEARSEPRTPNPAPQSQFVRPVRTSSLSKAEIVAPMPPSSVAAAEPLKNVTEPGPSMSGMASMLKDSPLRDSPSKDDSFVMVGADDAEQYSPGGRPRPVKVAEEAYSPGGRPIVRSSKKPTTDAKHVPEISIPSLPQTKANIMSPGANAPMVLEDYIMPGLPSPGANAPMLVEPPSPNPPSASANAPIPVEGSGALSKRSSTGSNLKFEPARPVYTPFRYNPSVQAPLMPADKSYSSLRKDGEASGRLLKHDSKSSATPGPATAGLTPPSSLQPPAKMQDEAFIGLIRQQSTAVKKQKPSLDAAPLVASLRPGTPAGKATASPPATSAGRTATPIAAALRPRTPATHHATPPPPQQTDLKGAIASLRASLPASVPDDYGQSTNDKVGSVKTQIDAIPDQFGFIHQTVLAWDDRNRQVRKRLDDERNTRQADSEARIDDMFNDNEIGYADIGELEAEFKLSEARLKYDEDKDELDSFTRDVYETVTGRLQSELAELNAIYTTAVDLLDLESEPASQCLKHSSTSTNAPPEMALLMSLLLTTSTKIEIRQQKIAEAKVERERRRKRLELTVLYTNGDTPAVKKLEAEFAVAERMQVLHEARERDNRANKLMDTFDRATVRVGDNQALVDEVLPKVRHVRDLVMAAASDDPDTSNSDVLYGAQGLRPTLTLTQSTINILLLDSQRLLTLSQVADSQLNDADYAVSVAEARVSNAERTVYEKLKEEKEKEDAKIVEDTQGRVGAVGKGMEGVAELCREVVGRIGDDGEHKVRLERALEEARRRNEVKDGVGG
ncbi:uncharacterized protein AB675_632 [Cyphellophora attinorum]|uniref:Uncharacterized protein n=1 Tax=Cyphellophora attinorum TaxID=1664694 RepID=A0A0N1HYJ0_9EURO|nr:uncharacterized protein AB675_632 [Phialophora attinorum]KPI45914.1 hypothetical protein AB675_632 [Phialophora attinorum]